MRRTGLVGLATLVLSLIAACGDSAGRKLAENQTVESCMQCHNGSNEDNYAGPGMENPHPFSGAGNLLCTDCHGGHPTGTEPFTAHIPRPPDIGDDQNLIDDQH